MTTGHLRTVPRRRVEWRKHTKQHTRPVGEGVEEGGVTLRLWLVERQVAWVGPKRDRQATDSKCRGHTLERASMLSDHWSGR